MCAAFILVFQVAACGFEVAGEAVGAAVVVEPGHLSLQSRLAAVVPVSSRAMAA